MMREISNHEIEFTNNMQTIIQQDPEDTLFIEFTKEDNAKYALHLSFHTTEKAEIVFAQIKGMLPVERHDNRIIILPAHDANSPGVYHDSFYISIRFCQTSGHFLKLKAMGINTYQDKFISLLKTSLDNRDQFTKLPGIHKSFYANEVVFHKLELIHPHYSLEKARLETTNLS